MIGIKCYENSLGLGSLMILNLHFVCEVVIVIVQVILIQNTSNNELYKSLWIFYVHIIVWISLAAAFYGIFNDKPLLMIPQIILQTCGVIVAAVNILSLIFLSHLRIVVFTEVRKYLPHHSDIGYFYLYLTIVAGILFVGLYFYFLMVIYSYYKILKREVKFNKSVSKSSTDVTEEIIL